MKLLAVSLLAPLAVSMAALPSLGCTEIDRRPGCGAFDPGTTDIGGPRTGSEGSGTRLTVEVKRSEVQIPKRKHRGSGRCLPNGVCK